MCQKEKTIEDYNKYVHEMVTDFRDFTILHYRLQQEMIQSFGKI